MDTQTSSNEKRDNIELVAIDIDGTLLGDKHTLSNRNRDAIKKAAEKGIKVILATGKTRASTESVIAALDLDTPGVFVQGLMIYNGDGTVRHQQTLDTAVVRNVVQHVQNSGFNPVLYSGNRLLVQSDDDSVMELTKYNEPKPEVVGPLVNMLGTIPIHKIFVPGSSAKKLRALRWQLNQQIGMQVSFTHASVINSLEILPKGTSKGNGVRLLLKQMAIDPANVMAIGDADNDVEMLELAGFSVAVDNATEKAKAVVDAVVSSNNDDGVAEAFERFVLGKEDNPPTKTAPVPQTGNDTEPTASSNQIDTTTTAEGETTTGES